MMNHGIIFDCDGTLMNSLGQALESFNFALEKVGVGRKSPEEIKRYFGGGADRILLSLVGDESRALEAFDYYLDHQTELATETKLHDGVKELLEILSRENVPMAVVTGRHERDLEIVLKPHKLNQYFKALVTDNHIPKSKPAPDGILLAARKMGIQPGNAFYVGDSVVDLQAANSAGCGGIAALWDTLTKPEEMKRFKPAFMAYQPSEVWEFFKTFLRTQT